MSRIAFLALIAGLPLLGGTSPISTPPGTTMPSAMEVRPPFDVRFETENEGIRPGATVSLRLEVLAGTALGAASLRLETEGEVILEGPATIPLGPLAAGEVLPVSVPVRYPGAGESAVHAWLEVRDPGDSRTHSRRGSLFALVGPDRTLAGSGGMLSLRARAVREDLASGRIDPGEAAERRRLLTTAPVERGPSSPLPGVELPHRGIADALVGAGGAAKASGSPIIMEGHIYWQDENGDPHPMFGAVLELKERNGIGDVLLATVITDGNGFYSHAIPNKDADNGIPDVFVRVHARNALVRTMNDDGEDYTADGPVDVDNGASTIVYNLTVVNSGVGPAFAVFQAATWTAAYAAMRNGTGFPQIDVIWPVDGSGSKYDGDLVIGELDRWDWDTIGHEFGHYVMDELDIEENPGGDHMIGWCLSVQGDHTKADGIRFAWGEGWPTFFAVVAQREMGLAALSIPRVGDTLYEDTEGDNVKVDLDAQDFRGRGEDNEAAVARFLWDAYDGGVEGRDAISIPDQVIWNVIAGNNTVTLSQAWIALWHAMPWETRLGLGEIAADHQIGPSLSEPEESVIQNGGGTVFHWDADVQCDPSLQGDRFELIFYSHLTFEPIVTLAPLFDREFTLSQAVYEQLLANNHSALWGVKAYSTSSPLTGPYLGETRFVVFNTPPVADAGADVTAECAGSSGTPVQLDGTGSGDADGDHVVTTWSAPGVSWDNELSRTPVGIFPKGTTVVTLTVSDGYQEAVDEVAVTVVDTTPPSITCPAAATVECSSHCGTSADDEQLAAFFLSVSAEDVCDPDPVIAHDAPACVPLGTTEVVFTATDADGNAASCTTSVTVEDTTPPEITVLLNRDVLWPPNHRLSPIEAEVTVTDICDPDPTFALTSVVSSEADNGNGDGNTTPDIRGAELDTPDTWFELRAERAGSGTGRVYTIVYTATDASGNTAADTSTVEVPHDREGVATAPGGLSASSTVFTLAVPSRSGVPGGSVNVSRLYVGNGLAAIRPVHVRLRDLDMDETPDLLAVFERAALAALESGGPKEPIGFHYTAAGVHYLVPDIFLLEPGKARFGAREGGSEPGVRLLDAAGAVTWRLSLLTGGEVRAEVFSVLGRRVRVLNDGFLGAGDHTVRWDGRFETGAPAPAGMYLYRFRTPDGTYVRKLSRVH